MTRRICLITGSRAEYGHLRCLAREIADDPDLTLQWLVTGTHFSKRFGMTHREIEADGFVIDERVEVPFGDDSAGGAVRFMGESMIGISAALERLAPDTLVILGDRYEMLASAAAALVLGVPISHLHGGETTEAAFDESIRHAITKMAHMHFVAAEPYRRRVIQLGEQPDSVHNVGAPGLDNVANMKAIDSASLQDLLGAGIDDGFFLVTYHPVTLGTGDPAGPVREMLAAFDAFPDRGVLMTGVNADPGFHAIASALHDYAEARDTRVVLRPSLGETAYLGAMSRAAVVVGNSSSGIVEAPALGVPSVNIGDRQKGRLRTASVIDCGESQDDIRDAIERALDPVFRAGLEFMSLPYGRGGASRKIKELLKCVPLNGLMRKRFYDLNAEGAAGHVL